MKKYVILSIAVVLSQFVGCFGSDEYFSITNVEIYNIQKMDCCSFVVSNIIDTACSKRAYGVFITFDKRYHSKSSEFFASQTVYAATEPGVRGAIQKIKTMRIHLCNSASLKDEKEITDFFINDHYYQLVGDLDNSLNKSKTSDKPSFTSVKDFIQKFNNNDRSISGMSLTKDWNQGFVLWLPDKHRAMLKTGYRMHITIEFKDGTLLENYSATLIVTK